MMMMMIKNNFPRPSPFHSFARSGIFHATCRGGHRGQVAVSGVGQFAAHAQRDIVCACMDELPLRVFSS